MDLSFRVLESVFLDSRKIILTHFGGVYRMQEKFALRKTLRKVAAVGTSLAMVGVTVTGALAAGLGDYPSTLGFNNVAGQTVVVYGSSSDMSAAQDVVSGLPGGAVQTTQTTSTTPTVTSGLQYGVASLGTQAVADLFEVGANSQSEELDITDALNDTDNFGNTLENEDLAYLKDSSISVSMHDVSDDYDFHEEIRLGGNNNINNKITVETGLTYGDNRNEDWKSNLFLVVPQNSLGYYYVFDESLKDGNYIANSTTLEPFQIDFLGETISIENTVTSSTGSKTTNDVDTISLAVGKKSVLGAGESMTVTLAGQTYTVTMTGTTGTGSGKADITVTGPAGTQREVISQDTSISFVGVGPRPVQVRVEDVFDEQGTADDRTTLIVGTEQSGGTKGSYDARKTYDTGNRYIGEDDDDPIWVWHLGNLTGTSPTLGIRNALSVTDDDEDENPLVKHPPYVGDYMCLPNFYACMVFERMKETDDNFRWYEIDADSQKDLRSADNQASADQSNLRVIKLAATGTDDQGFVAGSQKTEELYLAINRSMIGIWRREQDGSDALPVVMNNSAESAGNNGVRLLESFATLDYGSTSVELDLIWDLNGTRTGLSAGAGGHGLIVVDDANNDTNVYTLAALQTAAVAADGYMFYHPINGTTADFYTGVMNDGDLALFIMNDTQNSISFLGRSDSDTTVANDLVYKDVNALVDISSWEEDTRTLLGTIVHDPDSDNSADKFKFAIPSDWRDYEAVVSFARPKAGYLSTTGLGGKPATGVGGPAASAVMVKDTEVGDVSRYNAVSVGGPCVNRVTASLLGVTFPACGAQSGLNSGEATLVLKDNGAKKALLVYGWDQADTARAAVLLKDPAVLKEKLNSAGKSTAESVMVRGTGMDVAAITVA